MPQEVMRILVVSNMYPSLHHPSKASFVVNRVDRMRAGGHELSTCAVGARPHRRRGVAKVTRSGEDADVHPSFLDARIRLSLIDRLRQARLGPTKNSVDRSVKAVMRHVNVNDFDVIHAHGMYGVGAGFVARGLSQVTGVPYVVHVHGSDIKQAMDRAPAAYGEVLDAASGTIFVSRDLLRTAKDKGFSGKNSVVIPNGVDIGLFGAMDRVRARDLLGVNSSHPVVAFVGNLIPVKGADLLPDIATELKRRYPAVTFVVVGQGTLGETVRKNMTHIDSAFLGQVPSESVAMVMAAADVLVLPSRSEGWPCVILESYAAGTPVVASKVGGVDEALILPDQFAIPLGQDFVQRFGAGVELAITTGRLPEYKAKAAEHSWESIVGLELDFLADIVRSENPTTGRP